MQLLLSKQDPPPPPSFITVPNLVSITQQIQKLQGVGRISLPPPPCSPKKNFRCGIGLIIFRTSSSTTVSRHSIFCKGWGKLGAVQKVRIRKNSSKRKAFLTCLNSTISRSCYDPIETGANDSIQFIFTDVFM